MNEDKINILIVDDLPEKLLVLDSVLEELGQNVVTARSGQEALRRVMEGDFAVILLDVNMPDMDGYETAALIRKRKKSAHTPIIFITAYADDVHTAYGYTLGAVDFILTPVVPEIIRTKVKVFVDLFRMNRQIQQQAEEQVALAREQAARSVAEETVSRLKFLAEASKTLASSLDLEATLRGLLGLVVPREADLGVIALLDEQRIIRRIELAWRDTSAKLQTRSLASPAHLQPDFADAVQRVSSNGLSEIIEEPLNRQIWQASAINGKVGLQPFQCQSLAVLPLIARGRALGALALAMEVPREGHPPRKIGAAEMALVEDLSHRAAIAIDNAQLYRDIQEADRSKNEFLSMLAHELRNPLAPLVNGIQVLRHFGSKKPEVQKVHNMMERQVNHLVRLVDDLLDISRITRDKIQLQIESVEVADVVQRAVEVSRPLLDSRGHELTVTLPPHSVRVSADPVRLAQILSNLLNNAAKYTEKRGKVSLIVEQEAPSSLVFRVRDNGMGIPSDMLSSVFDLFNQVQRSLDRSQGGLGIGLTLVRRLVEMHGGSVVAFSDGPNLGSEFVVRLPCLQEAVSQNALPSAERPIVNDSRHRVLVVDDNIDVADSTSMLLMQFGLTVQVAHDGPTALALASTFQPQIVLLDIGLPGMDGYEVARRLRKRNDLQRMLLVALSGYGQEEDRVRSKDAGFDHHLVKPATLPQLRSLLLKVRSEEESVPLPL